MQLYRRNREGCLHPAPPQRGIELYECLGLRQEEKAADYLMVFRQARTPLVQDAHGDGTADPHRPDPIGDTAT